MRSSCSVACLCLPCSTPTEALVAAWTARPEPQGSLPRLTPISTLMCNSDFSRCQALFCLGSISQPSRDLSKVSGLGKAWALQRLELPALNHQGLLRWPNPQPQAYKPVLPLLRDNVVEVSGQMGVENQQWGVGTWWLPHPVCRFREPSSQNQLCTLSPGETPPDPLEFLVPNEGEMCGDVSLWPSAWHRVEHVMSAK